MPLIWTRTRDGKYNDKPIYEYTACAEDREFHIVCAHDAGFGFTARNKIGYLTERYGIVWGRTLKRCKEQCEKINEKYQSTSGTAS